MQNGKTVPNAKIRRAEINAQIRLIRNASLHGIGDMADGTTPAIAKAINDSNVKRLQGELKRIEAFLSDYEAIRKASAVKKREAAFNNANSVLPANFKL